MIFHNKKLFNYEKRKRQENIVIRQDGYVILHISLCLFSDATFSIILVEIIQRRAEAGHKAISVRFINSDVAWLLKGCTFIP